MIMALLGANTVRLYARTASKLPPCHRLVAWKLPLTRNPYLTRCVHVQYRAGKVTRFTVPRTNRHGWSVSHRMAYSTQSPQQEQDFTHTMLSRLSRMEDSMRYHGYSTLRIGLGLLAVTGACIYVFREYIRENVVDEVSTVAHRSLSDEVVIQKAEEVSKDLLHAIFTDPTIHKQAVSFLNIIFTNQEVLSGLKQLLITVMRDPNTQQELTALLKWAINQAMGDPAFRDELAANLEALMDHDAVKASLLSLLTFALNHGVLKDEAEKFAKDVLASAMVQDEAAKLGQNAVKNVVADDVVQKQTGDAMWSAFLYSVRPRWWFGSSPPKESEDNSKQTHEESKPSEKETKSLASHATDVHSIQKNIPPKLANRTLPSADQELSSSQTGEAGQDMQQEAMPFDNQGSQTISTAELEHLSNEESYDEVDYSIVNRKNNPSEKENLTEIVHSNSRLTASSVNLGSSKG